MAHKYEIDAAVQMAADHLRRHYPADFDDWNRTREDIPLFSPLEHIGVVNLARLIDAPDILPAAFMRCCGLDPDILLEGFVREDGVVEKLSQEDLTRTLIARSEIVKADTNLCVYALERTSPFCHCPTDCEENIKRVLWKYLLPYYTLSLGVPWSNTSVAGYLEEVNVVPCEECMEFIRAREAEQLRELWLEWPETLRLGS